MSKKRKLVIVIDLGHGGHDPGALGQYSNEKTNVLNVGLALGRLLEKAGHTVIYTRKTDKFLSLSERANIANRNGADIFISLHNNSAASNKATGFETFIFNGTNDAKTKQLQNTLHDEIAKGIGIVDRGKKSANFAVLRETRMPAVLIEYAFINNPSDEKILINEVNKLAQLTAKGLIKFAGGKVSTSTPSTSKPSTSKPTPTPSKPTTSKTGKVLHLPKTSSSWRVYPTNKAPTKGNEKGYLNPKKFGGLTYDIVGNPQKDVYTIKTGDFGTVNIYAASSTGAKVTNKKTQSNKTQAKGTVHLPASAKTWRTYKLNVQPVAKNSDWSLTPSRYGGLTYTILGRPYPDVVTINTSKGKRNIYVGKGTGAVVK